MLLTLIAQLRSRRNTFLAISLLAAVPAQADPRTALDKYVVAPDSSYSYHLIETARETGFTAFILEMTSQTWLSTNEVNRPVWKHWLTIAKPDDTTHSEALLFISGGNNESRPPKSADAKTAAIAVATKSVVAELRMVPNQPLVFAGETMPRSEDALIAYTWDKFLRTGDERWPARLPMTKSAVRALDTITAFCAGPEGGGLKVNRFVVAGGSKRGWTTWTTAVVDKRVVAIIPMVIDVLNVEPSFRHHFCAYGFYSPAVADYTALRIMDWNGTPEFHALMKIEEPYEYRHRLTLPKFMINACGDQFFLPDSAQFYFNDLPGAKYLRYVPNTDHSLKNSDALETLSACYRTVLNREPLPRFSWTVEKDGAIRVRAIDKPLGAKLWQATNPNARDFRLETIGPAWQSSILDAGRDGAYLARVKKPEKGWTAFFVELTFPSSGPDPFKFTTQVNVVPDTLPYTFQAKPPRSR
ncbi:MAG: PhoPQ-activated pathogenicity [Verrucomicrobia bacterium]|nr:MAG: PhoPQ-activated pathogenicity [Verrucomicrobiota bacterium]